MWLNGKVRGLGVEEGRFNTRRDNFFFLRELNQLKFKIIKNLRLT